MKLRTHNMSQPTIVTSANICNNPPAQNKSKEKQDCAWEKSAHVTTPIASGLQVLGHIICVTVGLVLWYILAVTAVAAIHIPVIVQFASAVLACLLDCHGVWYFFPSEIMNFWDILVDSLLLWRMRAGTQFLRRLKLDENFIKTSIRTPRHLRSSKSKCISCFMTVFSLCIL